MKKLLIAAFILLLPAFAFAGSTAVIGAATAVDGSWSMIYTGDNPTPAFSLGAGHNWTIYWGDGTSSEIVGVVWSQTYAHTYASSNDWQIRIMPGGGSFSSVNFGDEDVVFDVANLPRGLTNYLRLKNTSVDGDIANLPSGLDGDLSLGFTSVDGDIANLPSGLAGNLSLYTTFVEGDIANLPSGLACDLYLYNTSVDGDIANLPSGLAGDLYLFNTNISAYTAESWPCNTGNGKTIDFDDLSLSETEVDNILCHLVDHGATGGELDLTGNAAPSATGLACETTLEDVGMGWTVTVHGE